MLVIQPTRSNTFSMLGDLRRQIELALGGTNTSPLRGRTWPAANLYDDGDELVLVALVPGLEGKGLEITATAEALMLAGQRKAAPQEGYVVHRQERRDFEFTRSFALPTRIDPEKVSASLERGVLRVRMAKAAETKPRQITVKSAA